jgi:hypothetical protein
MSVRKLKWHHTDLVRWLTRLACFVHWLDDGGHGGHHRGLHLAHHEYLIEMKVCKDPKAIIHIEYTTNKIN